MSDNFGNKGYEDYFKALEQQFNNASEQKKPAASSEIPIKAKKKPKRLGGIYWVFRLRKSVLAAVVLIIAIALTVILIPKGSEKEEDTPFFQFQAGQRVDKNEDKISEISYTFTEKTAEIPAGNDARAAIIIDKSTNRVIASRNPHQKNYPASTTKIMTLLVAAENLKDLNDTFTMTLDITDPLFVAEASVAGFLNGETITVKDLLYGMILPSGADGAMGLAIKTAGSEEEFVKLMNKKVKELGLTGTHFTNVSGLHSEQNYSTAYDMAVILDAALQNGLCREVLSTYQYTTSVTPQHGEGILLSSTLFSYMYGTESETATVLGGKTGFVNESGYCIASYGKGNESQKEYIIVTLGNSARWPAFYGQIDLYKEFVK